jgi:transcriptional regulator with XRE-family HTH domain
MNKEQAAQRIGQRITALRKMEGISQQELADGAGLTRQHIGRIENGELVNVAYVTIQQIAKALGMTVDIIDSKLADLDPMKTLTPEPMTGWLGEKLDKKVTEVFSPKDTGEPDPKADIKAKRIEDCDVSVRARNICIANDIYTLGDLCQLHKTDWLKFRNSGKKTLFELDDLLHDNGLDWAEWR